MAADKNSEYIALVRLSGSGKKSERDGKVCLEVFKGGTSCNGVLDSKEANSYLSHELARTASRNLCECSVEA